MGVRELIQGDQKASADWTKRVRGITCYTRDGVENFYMYMFSAVKCNKGERWKVSGV